MGFLIIKIYFKNCEMLYLPLVNVYIVEFFKNLDSMSHFEKPTSVILALPIFLIELKKIRNNKTRISF